MEKRHRKRALISGIIIVLLLLAGFVTVNASQNAEVKKQVEIGNKYLSEGRYEEAILAFEKVLEVDEANVDARIGLSKAYVAVKKPLNAEEVLKKGIKLTPKKDRLYVALSDLYLDQNRIEEAVEVLDQGYSKTKSDDIKEKLDKISSEIQITVATNPLQVNNKTKVVLERKDENGTLTAVAAKWSTVGENIGEIQAAENKTALFTAKASGKGEIVGKLGSIEKKAPIEVKESVVASIEIVSQTNKATVGDSLEFKAIVKDQLGNELKVEPTWEMSGDIATMASNQGFINKFDFVKDGTGDITAFIGDVKSTVGVSVEKKKFTIVTVISGQGEVDRTPNLEAYESGAKVKLEAKPKEGWLFKAWQGDLESTKNPVEVTLDSNKNFKVVFEQKQYRLSTEVSGEGIVKRSKNADSYAHGSKVTLTAIPKEGWRFHHWEGSSNSENAELSLTMKSDKQLKAVFVMMHYDITTSVSGEGNILKEETSNNTYKLTAVPSEGWEFKGWEGDISGSTNPVVVKINSNKNVKAIFVQKQYAVNITSEGIGSVEKTEQWGNKIKLTAIPAEGWSFSHWEGDLTGTENPAVVEANSDKNIKAVFIKKKYKVNITIEGNGKVEQVEKTDGKVQLTAIQDEGWNFDHWEGDLSGSANPAVIELNSDKNVKAVFSKPSTEKNVTVNPDERVIAGYIEVPDGASKEDIVVQAFFGTISGSDWPDLNIKSPNGEWFGFNTSIMGGSSYQENTSNASSTKATYTGYASDDEKMTFENPVSGRWYIEIRNDGGTLPSTFKVQSNYIIYTEVPTGTGVN